MKHRGWDRRDFLRAAFSAPLAGSMLMAAEPNIRWSLGLVTWRGKAEWPDILADVDAAGFDGVEPFTAKFLNDQAMDELAKLLPKYPKLRMSSIYWSGPFHTPSEHDRLKQQSHQILGYLKRFGADRLTFGPPRPDVEDEKVAVANTAKIANEIGRISLVEYNIRTDIHPHVGSLIENPRQIDMLMDQTDPKYFNLAPDTAQVWMGGGDPVALFEKYKHRIIYMHYKDIRAYHRGLPGYMDNVIELGRGVIDFPALHRILRSVNYKGWIAIDLDNARISPRESGKVQKEYIDRVLAPIYS
jgi:inosose dehydratase